MTWRSTTVTQTERITARRIEARNGLIARVDVTARAAIVSTIECVSYTRS